MTIGQRLKEERDRIGMNQTTFAALGGVLKGAQIAYESGKSSPTAAHLAAAAEHGLDVLYVVTGQRVANAPGPALLPAPNMAEPEPVLDVGRRRFRPHVRSDTTQVGAPLMGGFSVTEGGALLADAGVSLDRPMTLPVLFAAGEKVREYQVIPRIKAAASAGVPGGRHVETEDQQADVAGVLALECEFMRQTLGRQGPGFMTVQVAGDSMEPTLADGDVIIVDTAQNRIDVSGIYVVELQGNLLVKRVQLRIDGSLVLKSDNPAYEPETIQAGAAHTLRVLGRMTRLRFK
jgi:transcriptional regulator with XRE-family HTH domain